MTLPLGERQLCSKTLRLNRPYNANSKVCVCVVIRKCHVSEIPPLYNRSKPNRRLSALIIVVILLSLLLLLPRRDVLEASWSWSSSPSPTSPVRPRSPNLEIMSQLYPVHVTLATKPRPHGPSIHQ